MSTPDFDAAVERAARAAFESDSLRGPWDGIQFLPELANVWRESVRAALQASGWEEAARTLREIADDGCENFTTGIGSCFENDRQWPLSYTADRVCLPCVAHRWVAQYTPEGK